MFELVEAPRKKRGTLDFLLNLFMLILLWAASMLLLGAIAKVSYRVAMLTWDLL